MSSTIGPVEFDGCTVNRKTVDRIEVVGPMPDSGPVYDRLRAMGYEVTRSGCYMDPEMPQGVDLTRFHYVAEKEV